MYKSDSNIVNVNISGHVVRIF